MNAFIDAMGKLFDFSVTAELLGYPFVQQALLAAAALGLVSGCLAPLVVTRKMSFAVHGTAELAFTGAAAALLLGAKDAFACDIDDKCVGVAYENAALNGVGKEHYTVRAGDVLSDKGLQKEFGGDYDVIVANIVADVIIALAPQVGRLLKKGGIFLCSGIIDTRAGEVADALRQNGWEIETTRSGEGWYSYACR